MVLDDKSKQNIEIAEYCCKHKKYFHITASRSYYAAYQKIKRYLIEKNPANKTKRYNHGDLSVEIKKCILYNNPGQKLDWQSLAAPLNKLSPMHYIRLTADYEDLDVKPSAAEDCLQYAKDIIEVINSY